MLTVIMTRTYRRLAGISRPGRTGLWSSGSVAVVEFVSYVSLVANIGRPLERNREFCHECATNRALKLQRTFITANGVASYGPRTPVVLGVARWWGLNQPQVDGTSKLRATKLRRDDRTGPRPLQMSLSRLT